MPLVPFQSADRRTAKLVQYVLREALRSFATSLCSGYINQALKNSLRICQDAGPHPLRHAAKKERIINEH
jgi:hypothetical protein